MKTSTDVSKFEFDQSHVLLKPVLGAVDGSLQLQLPSINKLNQAVLATLQFSYLFGDLLVSKKFQKTEKIYYSIIQTYDILLHFFYYLMKQYKKKKKRN
jgi:hypothetical protein